MLECPNCSAVLIRQKRPEGIVYACKRCKGLAATLPVVRRVGARRDYLNKVWIGAQQPNAPKIRTCPHCGVKMSQTTPVGESVRLTLDVCKRCALIWFDSKEFPALPRTFKSASQPEPAVALHPKAREALAMHKIKEIKEREEDDGGGWPEGMQWFPALLGLPVETNAPKLARLPWLTWAFAVACIAAIYPVLTQAAVEGMPNPVIAEWGFIPAQLFRHSGLTLITSFFLHGGIAHLVSNMYFFIVFGDNVEDRLHRGKYLLLLFASHLAGAVLHGVLDPRPDIPLVGASAGISGILAYYAIAFPRVRVGFLWRFYFYFRWIRIPVGWALAGYIAIQIIGAIFQFKGFSSVSAFGHLGGVFVGIAAGIIGRMAAKGARSSALARSLEHP
jgi:membrane associated rhomboid family serine protease